MRDRRSWAYALVRTVPAVAFVLSVACSVDTTHPGKPGENLGRDASVSDDTEIAGDASDVDWRDAQADAEGTPSVEPSVDVRPLPSSATCSQVMQGARDFMNLALMEVDERCTEDSDCVAVAMGASCTDGCFQAAYSKETAGPFAATMAEVETELCVPLHKGNDSCLTEATGPCTVDKTKVARCHNGFCDIFTPACEEGCSVGANLTCVGSGPCNGCPALTRDFSGKPCAEEGRTCNSPGFCDSVIRCTMDPNTGEQRWAVQFTGCEQWGPPNMR